MASWMFSRSLCCMTARLLLICWENVLRLGHLKRLSTSVMNFESHGSRWNKEAACTLWSDQPHLLAASSCCLTEVTEYFSCFWSTADVTVKLKAGWLGLDFANSFIFTGETTKHWKGLMSNNQQWVGCRISSPKSNKKYYQIESTPNRRLPNRIFKLSNHSPKVFKSRLKSQSRLGFAHHWRSVYILLHTYYSLTSIGSQFVLVLNSCIKLAKFYPLLPLLVRF